MPQGWKSEEEHNCFKDIDFTEIFKALAVKWTSQVDRLLNSTFSGSPAALDAMEKIFSEGKMIGGQVAEGGKVMSLGMISHRQDHQILDRAVYALAIPAAWKGNKQVPVVLRFGNTCQIDARGYFNDGPDSYNKGWRCINGHSYILAGAPQTRGPPCAFSNPRLCERASLGQQRGFKFQA
ncbi:hypothetical protein PspLS_09827 [Pyricularia sp. CBS 133598]|nr:hypothetical protein PspLS_09827 [Pyricularia sp. CBS 133598]